MSTIFFGLGISEAGAVTESGVGSAEGTSTAAAVGLTIAEGVGTASGLGSASAGAAFTYNWPALRQLLVDRRRRRTNLYVRS
jgi:hypothetical protein